VKRNIFILIFILSLNSHFVKAQNFVYNGYFEILDSCPQNVSTPTPYQYLNNASGWKVTAGTPDLFNDCSLNSNNVPKTAVGFQRDGFNGHGFAGIFTYEFTAPNNGNEYVQTKLNDTLKNGKKYLVSMYVNQCNNFNYSISSIGMYLTNTAIQAPAGVGIINIPNPQVKNNHLLKDTINWILIQDTLIGSGIEQYLTIGNFSPDSASDTVKVYNSFNANYSYYYIDAVSLYEINDSCNSYWDAGLDKYMLAGDSIRLGAINTDSSFYTWQNSLGGPTYLSNNTDARPWSKPTENTIYYVTKTCPNNTVFIDTVAVYVLPKVNLGRDSVFCTSGVSSVILDAGAGQNYTYHWSTGATTQTISVSNSGTYSVQVFSYPLMQGGSNTGVISLNLLNNSNANILHDTDLCNISQFPIVLNASVPVVPGTNNAYTWTGGHVGAQLTVNSPGTYIVTVWIRSSYDNSIVCKVKDTAIVTVGCVGIKQFIYNDSHIDIYPNPNNGTMALNYSVKENANLEISDLSGRLVGTYFLPATGTHAEVKNNELYNGLYIYRVTCNGVVIKIGKIIVMQ
jgi:hypothetical protein